MELRFKLTRKRVLLSVTAVALSLTSAGVATTLVTNAYTDAAGVYHGCVGQGSGILRVLGAGESCRSSEVAIEWNQGGPTGPQGPAGDKGSTGDKGPPGDKGPTGDPGAKGATGEAGAAGADGDKGQEGDKGPVGDKGANGDPGDKGATGDKGPAGEKGLMGDKGPTGDKGPIGDRGPQGPAGTAGGQTTFLHRGAMVLNPTAHTVPDVVLASGVSLYFRCTAGTASTFVTDLVIWAFNPTSTNLTVHGVKDGTWIPGLTLGTSMTHPNTQWFFGASHTVELEFWDKSGDTLSRVELKVVPTSTDCLIAVREG